MLNTFQQFIKESEDLFVPRNLEGRNDKYLRNLQRKLDSCNGFWEGNLDLQKMEISSWFKISDNLKVSGEINLAETNIYELPKNLQCEDLYLRSCKNIKELPEGLNVKYTISLTESSIEKLPENLQCKHLMLYYCQNIKELPKGLNVLGEINLVGSSIERLPKNLQCEDLWLAYCKNIKELPEGLKVKNLHINNSCLTKEYCRKLKKEGKILYNRLYDQIISSIYKRIPGS